MCIITQIVCNEKDFKVIRLNLLATLNRRSHDLSILKKFNSAKVYLGGLIGMTSNHDLIFFICL